MGWTVTTYAGTRAIGSPSSYRTCMFELIRGIREREAVNGTIPGHSIKTFYKATGTPVSGTISMADLNMLTLARAEYNLKNIRDSILSFIASGVFYTDDTFATQWTKALMETDIGTDLDADPAKPNEARYWQAMQDSLDRLIYQRVAVSPSNKDSLNKFDAATGTPQDVWDSMLADSPSAGAASGVSYSMTYGTGNSGNAGVGYGSTFDIDSTALNGIATHAAYSINWFSQNKVYFTDSLNVLINTLSISEDNGKPVENYVVNYAADLADVPFGTVASCTMDIVGIASTVPFDMTVSEFRTSTFQCNLLVVYFGIDISSELTDQA